MPNPAVFEIIKSIQRPGIDAMERASKFDPLEERMKALKVRGMEQELANAPEERNWLNKLRGMKEEVYSREIEEADYKKNQRIFREVEGMLNTTNDMEDLIGKLAPRINFENYPTYRNAFVGIGSKLFHPNSKWGEVNLFESSMPEPEYFVNEAAKYKTTPDVFFDAWKNVNLKKVSPTKAGDIELLEREEGTFRVNKLTGESERLDIVPGKKKEPKTSIHYETDNQGNTVKIVTDASGATVRTEPMGRIGKSREPRQGGEEAKISKLGMVKKNLDEDYAQMMGEDISNLPKKMSPKQREAYQQILSKAEKYATTMTPRAAVDAALRDFERNNKAQKATSPDVSGMDKSIKDALEAIEAGASEEAVRKRFKEKYNKELPSVRW